MRNIVKYSFWLFVIIVIFLSFKELINNKEDLGAKGSEESSPQMVEKQNDETIKVVVDPGHGGVDPGAIGASGSYEKDFTLDLSKKLVALLENDPNLEVLMTREGDQFLSSEARERPNFANDLDADLFLSIHANTYSDPSVSGTETFYYDQNSKPLADTIHKHLVNATGYNDRGVKQENFFVLKDTNMPAVLLEIGYLTNPQDEQKMMTDVFQQSVAEAITDGINEYLDG
ncbi:N-acetylmuramoyl-L-alanine amidase family protein [Gracilibacillus suaedae]|uniref:N-acetylmuramoyl-L-alanine amidase family protein n=1 Tax=Gracilibacillus suaedae TaxID=2820273 RepID=UPI001ABED2AB|nr:N-acetylmuramoyl-L-alanine amidase [Gracilibacillus suaedae]